MAVTESRHPQTINNTKSIHRVVSVNINDFFCSCPRCHNNELHDVFSGWQSKNPTAWNSPPLLLPPPHHYYCYYYYKLYLMVLTLATRTWYFHVCCFTWQPQPIRSEYIAVFSTNQSFQTQYYSNIKTVIVTWSENQESSLFCRSYVHWVKINMRFRGNFGSWDIDFNLRLGQGQRHVLWNWNIRVFPDRGKEEVKKKQTNNRDSDDFTETSP